ncbi:MAG: hypothetical protein ACI9S8_001654 [Chlamydiales bacterium]|jgi:hypothetical protein
MLKNRSVLLACICFAFSSPIQSVEHADEEFSSVKEKLRAENIENLREKTRDNGLSTLEDDEDSEETRHAQTTNKDRSIEELFDEIIDQIEDSESAT